MEKLILFVITLSGLQFANAAPLVTGHYSGTLGKKSHVEMDLTQTGEVLNGSYYYHTPKNALLLSGHLLNDGAISLQEKDASGKITGAWVLKILPSGEIQGSWNTPDQKKTLTVSLIKTEAANTVGDLQYSTTKIKVDDRELPLIQLTHFHDLKLMAAINLELKKFTEDLNPCDPVETKPKKKSSKKALPETEEETYDNFSLEVTKASDGVLSIKEDYNYFCTGALHPYGGIAGFNIDLHTGKKISVEKLFKNLDDDKISIAKNVFSEDIANPDTENNCSYDAEDLSSTINDENIFFSESSINVSYSTSMNHNCDIVGSVELRKLSAFYPPNGLLARLAKSGNSSDESCRKQCLDMQKNGDLKAGLSIDSCIHKICN